MRKLLLTSVVALVPFAAFAGGLIGGDANLAQTEANSWAGVKSLEGTGAHGYIGATGGVTAGAVSGNYSSVGTSARGTAGPLGSKTNTTATQTNLGGTVYGGQATNPRYGGSSNGGSAGGFQNSQAEGGATANANNTSLGGFATMPGKFGHR
jgi:hypothetical protein